MTRRRWIADEVSDNRAALIGDHAGHLVRVLRVRIGQEFDIVANTVPYRGRVSAISEDRVEFDLLEEIPAPAQTDLTLFLSIFKFDRMEWAIEKCTELGVSRIVPLIARRTDSHLASASLKRIDRWRRIVTQAAEQSRRTTPPEIRDPVKLGDVLEHTGTLRIVLSEAENQVHLRELLAGNNSGETTLAIGPEGGWTEDELHLFQKNGWTSASLGSTILRAETAAIAATVLAISAR